MAEKHSLIVPLKGPSNYATWRVQCKMALTKEGLWGIVSGNEAAPAATAEPKVIEAYNSRKDKALATVVLAVHPSLLYLFGDPTDPVVVWKKLEDQFQKKSWANRLHLRRKLHSMKLKENESVQDHVKVMLEIFNELSVVGDAITDDDKVVYLLASLPESFDTLVTALESNVDVPQMDTVIERLIHEERKLKDRQGSSEPRNSGALAARHKNKPRGPQCYGCKKFGHIQRNCPERAHDSDQLKKVKKGRKNESAHKARVKSDESDSDEVGLVTRQLLSVTDSSETDQWIIDSGATCHMCNDRKSFVKIATLKKRQDVALGDGHILSATKAGDVTVKLLLSSGKTKRCRLQNVLYVPDLSYNLLSVSKVSETGKRVKFYSNNCHILDEDDKVVATGVKRGNLYYLSCEPIRDHACMSDARLSNESKEFIWHRRFGHLNEKSLQTLASQQLVYDFDYHISKPMPFCKACVEGKLHRTPFPSGGRKRAETPLDLVHSDVCGPIGTESLSGAKYFVTFVDDKTHYIWVYVLKTKSEVFSKFQEWKSLVERTSSRQLKILRTDNGGEYTSNEFEELLKSEGVRHEKTIPKNPEQNGVAERLNRTLLESTRSMLADTRLPQKFWAEALSTAVYLRNRSSTSTVHGMTPFEAWSGEKPSVRNLRAFGCTAYSHVPKDERKKLSPKAKRCIFIGYGDTTKGYRLYDPTRGRVIHSRDVVFDETSFGFEEENLSNDEQVVDLNTDTAGEEEIHTDDEQETSQADGISSPVAPRRSGRTRNPPDYYGTWISSYSAKEKGAEPATVDEAMSSPDKEKWKQAMDKEMKSIAVNNVWQLVKLPEGKKAIGCKWVYKHKTNADGSLERYKARLVAKGYSQEPGLDYDETFSPVARFESLRTLLALAVQDGLHVHQMDVTTAFLNGELKEEVYMDQPEGFKVPGKEDYVCKLRRSLYGLKQAPRCWNVTLDEKLKEMGFVQANSDPCLYVANKGEPFVIGVYVDDILLAGSTKKRISEVKSALAERFDMKDLGELNHYLGVKIVQNRGDGTIWIGQSAYTEEVLKKFGMESCKPVTTPVEVGVKLTQGTDDSEYVDAAHYQSVVGSLLYLSMRTRPDITFAVSLAARFCSKPTSQHMTAVKRILRYLRGTTHYGLLFKRSSNKEIIGYCDADWGGDAVNCKSTSGYMFQIGGTAVTWQSRKQSCVALSTAEAEYVSLAGAAQEAVWLRQLIKDLTKKCEPVKIFEDNQSAIAIARNPQFHGRMKHINIKYHFVRECVNNNEIVLKYCRTDEMVADMLTKALGKIKFEKLRELAGVVPLKNY